MTIDEICQKVVQYCAENSTTTVTLTQKSNVTKKLIDTVKSQDISFCIPVMDIYYNGGKEEKYPLLSGEFVIFYANQYINQELDNQNSNSL